MKTHIIQTNFTAGEVTPKLLGRVDIQRYQNAAKHAENVTVVVQGGLRRRDGLQFCYEVKAKNKNVRLIPFIVSREETFMLEVGFDSGPNPGVISGSGGYIRFYQNGKIIWADDNDLSKGPYEVAVPELTAEMLPRLNYTQAADTMYFAHGDMPPCSLVRNGQKDWKWAQIKWGDGKSIMPFAEVFDTPEAWINPTFTGTQVVGMEITLTIGGDSTTSDLTKGYTWKGTETGKYVRVNGGIIKLTSAPAGSHTGKGTILSLMYATDGKGLPASPTTWTLEQFAWGPFDTTADPVTGKDKRLGWPSCVAFHQQRLLFAGTKSQPQTFWGSAVGRYTDFELGYVDDSAYSFSLDSDQTNPITALVSMNALIALTHSNEFILSGTNNTITPSNISVRVPSNYGAIDIKPVRVGTELVYVQRAGRKVLSLSYDPDSQTAYSVSDISVLAEHLTHATVVDMTFQQEPEGLIHLVTADGMLITVTFNKENEVTGWTRNTTGYREWTTQEPDPDHPPKRDGPTDPGGKMPVTHSIRDNFLNVASIPFTGGIDHCYVVTERDIGGVKRYYVEIFREGLNVDAALVGEQATGVSKLWGALDHLEGREVDIVGDGVVMPARTVGAHVAGSVELPYGAAIVNIGLPFYSKITTLNPEYQSPVGSVQGARVSTSELKVRLLDTVGLTINGDAVPFRNFGKYILNKPTPLFTGDMNWQLTGWANNEVTIEQRQPLPFHVLAIIRTITAN